MGWNQITIEKQDDPLFEGIPNHSYVYFVHSYWADTPAEYCITSTDYINTFASSIRNGTAVGVQFHPEKAGNAALQYFEFYRAGMTFIPVMPSRWWHEAGYR